MELRIDARDGVPIYLQICNQVKHLVAAGRLGSGDELPPIRTLAEQLVINPNTVARAYLELERWKELHEVATRLVTAVPASAQALRYQQWAMIQLGQWDAVEKAAREPDRIAERDDDLLVDVL